MVLFYVISFTNFIAFEVLFMKSAQKPHAFHEKHRFSKDHLQRIVTLCLHLLNKGLVVFGINKIVGFSL